MSSILLVLSIAAMGLIIFCYVFDEATRGGQAKSGLLGMADRSQDEQPDTAPGWKSTGKRPWRVGKH